MFEREELIPAAEEILERLPLPAALKKVKAERDRLASDVIRGNTDKLLLIIGPCSAHESPGLCRAAGKAERESAGQDRDRAAHLYQ